MNLPCDPMSMTDDDARRVVAEAEVLKLASDHPNVVRFHGAFEERRPALFFLETDVGAPRERRCVCSRLAG